MKQLAEKLKILQGTVVKTAKVDDEDSNKIIIRKGTVQEITDNLIIVKFISPSGNTFIECFNKGDLIVPNTVIDRETHTITIISDSVYINFLKNGNVLL